MQNVSSSYLEKIKEPSRSFECRVTIGNNVYTNIDIIHISIEDVQPSDGFTIGAAVSKSLELTLSTNNTIYSNSKVKLEIGLNIGSTFEYILIGHFHIEDIISTDYSTKLTCYDNMIKFEKPYFSNLGKTSTLKNIVNELATITGVEFTGSLPSYNLNKLEGFTCREILGFVASICGGNAYITREGKFTIKTPATIDYSITSDNYIDLKSEEDLYKVGAITCKANDKELTKGTLSNSSMEITFENPWVTESILTDIYNKLKGFEFIGYSMKWQGDFSLDVGDIISITDTKGNTMQVPIFSQKLTYNGGLTSEIGAKGESKTKNEFSPTGDLNNKVNRVVTDLLIVNKALINKADIEDFKAVNAEIENLIAQNVTITGKLNAIEGEFGTLKVNVGVIDKLTVTHTAQINALEANKASIVQLEAVSAKIGTVEAEVGKINTLLAGNLTGGNIQAGGITSDKLTIANGFITNAMIANLDVSKINAGDISTNKFKIKSDNGGIEIVGATQQFKDKNNRVRIQMGQDTKGNFNFIIRGEDGTTTLIDHTGIKEKAIADDLIKETMIAQDAIGEKQINYSSFITGFNKDTNTNTIKSTKIMLNNQNQTLDVAFSQLKTQADGTKTLTESHSTTIGVMQGQISTAINNTQIVKDGQTILLKDDYNRTVQTIDSMKSTIGSHTSQISGLNSTVSTQGSSIEQLKGQIALKVEQTDITTAINNVQIGGRNYIITDKVSTYTPYNTITDRSVGYIKSTWKSSHTGDIFTLSVTNFTPKKSIYTISGTIKVNGKIPSERYFNGLASTYGSGLIRNDYDNATGRFVITQSYPGNSIWIFHVSTIRSSGSSDIVELFNLKFEEGNKPTDWTPAPEDTQGQLDAHTTEITTVKSNVASIETNLSSITSRVSSAESTLTKTTNTANSAKSTADSAKTTANNAQTTANANKSSISTLTTRVSTAESKLTKDSLTTTIGNHYTTTSDVNGIVTSKGYQTSSQVQQTVNAFELKFQESGGYNLLYNGDFKNGTTHWYNSGFKIVENSGYSCPNKRAMVASGVIGITKHFYQTVSNIKGGVDHYTVSYWYYVSDGTNGTTNPYYHCQCTVTYTDGTKAYPSYNHTTFNKWIKASMTIDRPSGKTFQSIAVNFYCRDTTRSVYISEVMFEEGEVVNGFTPNPNEVYDGITTIDKDGITVISSNAKSKTSMSANGFAITRTDNNKDIFRVGSNGVLTLNGVFKCYKDGVNMSGARLESSGAIMFGYNTTGGNNPVFASGLWTDENMGYFSVGYTRADITDANGCLYMSPQEGNQGGRLTFSRLKDSQVAHTTLYFQKDGAIDFYSGLRGLYENDDNYTYRFDAGTSVKALRCNRLRSYDIYPRGNNTYDIGFTNGGCFSNIWGNNICTNQSHLYLGTAQASGAWNTYGTLAINSATGYIFPAKYNGALGLGMSNNRFSGLYSVNAVNVSSDSRLKTDIHYLEEPTGETVILENRVERNMHITTKDMYDFVKDELKLASYRYNINLEKGNTSVDYGFIAQDILYTKVGSEIVQLADENNLNSELSYNQGNYISVIAGALQQEIRKRDKEIKELRLEIENLKSQRKLEVA